MRSGPGRPHGSNCIRSPVGVRMGQPSGTPTMLRILSALIALAWISPAGAAGPVKIERDHPVEIAAGQCRPLEAQLQTLVEELPAADLEFLARYLGSLEKSAAAALLAAVGAFSTPMWPLAKAMAFARVPGRPGLVAALDHLTFPIELAAPLAVGAIATAWGPAAAVAALGIQPVVVGAIALLVRASPVESDPPGPADV
ncbi:MAG: hypothetical protein ABMB14_38755 [Myxococcota bacterium]